MPTRSKAARKNKHTLFDTHQGRIRMTLHFLWDTHIPALSKDRMMARDGFVFCCIPCRKAEVSHTCFCPEYSGDARQSAL